jgi:hypothetical protein
MNEIQKSSLWDKVIFDSNKKSIRGWKNALQGEESLFNL